MKKSLVIGVVVIAALMLLITAFTRLSQSQSIPVVENSVTELARDIQSSTKVPLALPSIVPLTQNYYSSVGEVAEDHYSINLDAVRDCQGVSNCNLGVVSGEVAPVQSVEEEYGTLEGFKPVAQSSNAKQSVTLMNGIQGLFIPYMCGASCSTSKVVWGENGYRYMVSLQAKSVPEAKEVQSLVDMANSAIANRKQR